LESSDLALENHQEMALQRFLKEYTTKVYLCTLYMSNVDCNVK